MKLFFAVLLFSSVGFADQAAKIQGALTASKNLYELNMGKKDNAKFLLDSIKCESEDSEDIENCVISVKVQEIEPMPGGISYKAEYQNNHLRLLEQICQYCWQL